MKILIVDSKNPGSLELDRVVAGWGNQVSHVSSGALAVEAVKQHTFELVMLELFLQDTMGYEIVPDLKLFNPGVSIIIMSEKNDPELEMKSRESGIIFFMEKPVRLEQLKQILNQLSKHNHNFGGKHYV
ncbi:MAG: response regulator [Desulfobacterales bacterium]|nr:response regulator [Desulfobacterales bacterium]